MPKHAEGKERKYAVSIFLFLPCQELKYYNHSQNQRKRGIKILQMSMKELVLC